MSERTPPPQQASIAVIGGGIVGSCLVEHLAQRGWDDLVLIEKGPLPDPGGSTGHASNFIFPTDHNREVAMLTLESQRQYEALGVQTTCGGVEVARTEARMEELRRRMTSARAWGIDAELLAPGEVAARIPFVNPAVILGGFWMSSVSVVDGVRAGTLMRERALSRGALTILDNTEVTGMEVEHRSSGRPRLRAVLTARGRIEVEHAVIACGVWSPLIAELAGASIPLTPAVHQMGDVGPVDLLRATGDEIGYPIVRDMDAFMYERQKYEAMEVGSYAHRPILVHPEEIPSRGASERSPTEMPFTEEDFAPQLEQAHEIMGELLGDAEMGYAINGLLSLTPDAHPVLGETAEVANLWSAAAVWIKEGPGAARLLAEWITHGHPRLCDPHESDVTRFQPHERTRRHVRARAREHFNKTYGIVHPREQWESRRDVHRSALHARTEALGAVYYEARGWERPQWYESNTDLVDRYRIADRPHEWDRRWWSPIIEAEHLHLREKVGVVDLGAFQIFDVTGPGALAWLEGMAANACDRPPGTSIYTPLLTPDGGFRADLTIQRLAADRFRVVTGAFDGARDAAWFRKHLPDEDSVHFEDLSAELCALGVWGPGAEALLGRISGAKLSQAAFPYASVRDVSLDGIPVTMCRISYVGESGWEIYVEAGLATRVWDAVREAGRQYGLRPVGAGVYGTTGRMEKGYALMGAELTSEYSPVEAGLARPRVKRADFIGRAAYLKAREAGPAALLRTLTMDDHADASGLARFPTGGNEPLLGPDGERIVDARGRESRITSAGMGPSVGKYLLIAYLPPELAAPGTRLRVLYMNEAFPVTVATDTALFDPTGTRMRS
ncbi:FAD-dependent oxidoreductase [Candidatus Palauibacter polyketidifaciens]|uniref:GcvT family protein n=1 Tax=Candidatus Palauibacter polyketidifaciens TaxID=3056740 RepID=UPI00238D9240|nr:FAD-dependent oxidoreductase [Candidatus Palauibacter polyketidifaciens]MDE2721710.1 FAD-dependent oxidoreductase [Candidatus Palauibacter polyketidifaciens]